MILVTRGFIQDLQFGGEKLKTFGIYVMDVHKQAPSRGQNILDYDNCILPQNSAEYRTLVAIPYVDSLLLNIKSRFTDKAVKIVTAMSIFSPSLLPAEASLPSYGSEQIKILAEFYGKEAEVEYVLTTYTSPPLLDGDELLSEWKIFRRALLVEKRAIMERKESVPSMQEILDEMNKSHTYRGIFPETWKLLNIAMALPVGTVIVERSFSQIKLIKTRPRSRLSDSNLEN